MKTIQNLGDRELDALREAINIGAAHAATALSQLTKQIVTVKVPRIYTAGSRAIAESLGLEQERIAAASVQVLGDITGKMTLTLLETSAGLLCDLMPGRDRGPGSTSGELDESTFKEVANILTAAYLNALAEFLGMMLLPSVPTFSLDTAEVVLSNGDLDPDGGVRFILCAEAAFNFEESRQELFGNLLLFPAPGSVAEMLDALRKRVGGKLM